MKLKICAALTTLCFLLAAELAMANHEQIVVPAGHSKQRLDYHNNSRSNKRLRFGKNARNQQSKQRFRGPLVTPYFGGGYGSGGDTVGRFTDNFGDTDRVRSGGGVYIEGGLLAAVDNATLLRLTAGYETDRADRFNGDASFDRTRFDLTLLRKFGVFELGVGLTAHVGVDFDCSIISICSEETEFDDALGYTLEYALTSLGPWGRYSSRRDKRLHPLRTARFGLRFTDIEYTVESGFADNVNDDDLDGKSLSLFIGFAL